MMIDVSKVSKSYRLNGGRRGAYRTLRETMMEGVGRSTRYFKHATNLVRPSDSSHKARSDAKFLALNDVSFQVSAGEAVAIIGHNGAGKSTLLKILSRITEPSSGRVTIRGRLGSLLEVGTGFHPELTGRENIYLNGAILGMSRREVAQSFDEIVDFAEIQDFLDTPVKRYSSGMYVRLGFSVAAHMLPDVLLIDEVLAVGDLRFQRKCMERVKDLLARSSTVVLVSHNMFSVKSLCRRAIYLAHGQMLFDGGVDQAVDLYENDSQLTALTWAEGQIAEQQGSRPILITSVEILDEQGGIRNVFDHGERMRVRIGFQANRPITRPNFIVALIRSDNVACCNYSTAIDGITIPRVVDAGQIEVLSPPIKLIADTYKINLLVRDEQFQRLYCAQQGPLFHVHHEILNNHFGVYHENAEWRFL